MQVVTSKQKVFGLWWQKKISKEINRFGHKESAPSVAALIGVNKVTIMQKCKKESSIMESVYFTKLNV